MNLKNWNILILGEGISENALVWRLHQSSLVKKLYCIPGNSQMKHYCEIEDIPLDNYPRLLKFAEQHEINMVFFGTNTIVDDLAEYYRERGIRVIHPQNKAYSLESSRVLWKDLLQNYSIPVAPGYVFEHLDGALSYIENASYPLVAKTDDTTFPSTTICHNEEAIQEFLSLAMKEKIYGEAGARVIIEKFLPGPVISVCAIVEEQSIMLLPWAHHIPVDSIAEGWQAIYLSPSPKDKKNYRSIESIIVVPLVHALNRYLQQYCGIITLNIVLSNKMPYVINFTTRWNYLPTQMILDSLQMSILDIILALDEKKLQNIHFEWSLQHSIFVLIPENNLPVEEYSHLKTLLRIQNRSYFQDQDRFLHLLEAKRKMPQNRSEPVVGIQMVGANPRDAYDYFQKKWLEMGLPENSAILQKLEKITYLSALTHF